MQYDPSVGGHGLPFDPFKSCVVPRPIGWISTTSVEGVDNLAPYSQFQNLTFDPPTVMFAANQTPEGRRKDSVNNAEQTGEFVWNIATYDLREAVNISATYVAADVDEFELARLQKATSVRVRPPRVLQSPVSFECEYLQTIRIPGRGAMGTVDLVIGRVLMIHIADEFIGDDGRIDIRKVNPLARLGYYDYATIGDTFEMVIPGNHREILSGLEGRSSYD